MKHLSVVNVRISQDRFETRNGVLVEVPDEDSSQDGVLKHQDGGNEEALQEADFRGFVETPRGVEDGDEDGCDREYEAQPNLTALARG